MNDLTKIGAGPQTMSSREIAELTGKRHDNVRRDIEAMAEGLSLTFEEKPEAPNGGRPMRVYLLPKRECLILVSGYDLSMRAKIIDRWQQLEEQARATIDPRRALSDPAALRTLLLENVKKVIELEAKVEADAPKVAAFERIAASAGSMTMTQAAKVLGVKLADLTAWMSANRWVYRQNNSWVAYRQHIENGRLEYKEAHYTDQETGMACNKPYCHITPKGLAKLATIFGKDLPKAA